MIIEWCTDCEIAHIQDLDLKQARRLFTLYNGFNQDIVRVAMKHPWAFQGSVDRPTFEEWVWDEFGMEV